MKLLLSNNFIGTGPFGITTARRHLIDKRLFGWHLVFRKKVPDTFMYGGKKKRAIFKQHV